MPASSTAELRDRLVRATIGRYDIYAELGRGGMAAVFLALDLALNRKVAIKVMLPELSSNQAGLERFRREARLAASLSHPQIIPIYAVGDSPELAWFAMKYVEGRSLDSVIEADGPQSPAFVQVMLQQIGAALDYAHQRGVIHRDIKPANIMLDEGGWFVLTDFGIAKASDELGLTSSGLIIGTPSYMSPEHFSGEAIGPAADQYALGCVAYELLTGGHPFARASVGELMRAHLLDTPAPVRERRPDCPASLEGCIAGMLKKTAADRFPTVTDAAQSLVAPASDDLKAVSATIIMLARSGIALRPQINPPLSPPPFRRDGLDADATRPPARPMPRGRRWPLAVGAGIVAIGAIAAMVLSGSPDRSPPPGPSSTSDASGTGAPTAIVTAPVAESATSASRNTGQTVGTGGRVDTRPSVTGDRRVGSLAAGARGGSARDLDEPAVERPTVVAETASPPPAPESVREAPQPPLPPAGPSHLLVGSRVAGAVLYVDQKIVSTALGVRRTYEVASGTHTIMVTAEGCANPYREVLTFTAGDTVKLNWKSPC